MDEKKSTPEQPENNSTKPVEPEKKAETKPAEAIPASKPVKTETKSEVNDEPMASVTKEIPTVTATPVVTEEKAEDIGEKKNWPVLPFVAGVIVAIVLFQIFNMFFGDMAGNNQANVIATVNGEEITQEELDKSVEQTETLAQLQGIDTSDPIAREELQDQALTIIINTKLLIQAAKDSGIEVSDEQIDEQYGAIETQLGGEEALAGQMEQAGLTLEDLREDIAEQIMVDEFIRNNTNMENIEVTQEEIAEVYNQLVEQGQEMPPLDTVGASIAAQIEAQKQQTAITELVDRLRAEADITTS